jgi:thiol-disulfide isomerase/thioredoxin
MHRLTWIGGFGLLALLLTQAPARPQDKKPDGDITVKLVKYDELCDVISRHRGKVVLVDFYTNDCIPCKKAFPYVVEMSRKYADQGLVTISVSLDPWDPDGYQPRMKQVTEKYLTMQGARMTNLMLNENVDVIQERLRIRTVPHLYVFDRQGRWTSFDGDRLSKHKEEVMEKGKLKYVKYTEVEGLVKQLLEK